MADKKVITSQDVMTGTEPGSGPQDLASLMEQNLALTEEIHDLTKKIYKFIWFSKIMIYVQIAFIIVPIIAAAIWLPPILGEVINQYKAVLNP